VPLKSEASWSGFNLQRKPGFHVWDCGSECSSKSACKVGDSNSGVVRNVNWTAAISLKFRGVYASFGFAISSPPAPLYVLGESGFTWLRHPALTNHAPAPRL